MYFSRGLFAGVVESDEIRGGEGLFGSGMGVVVLPGRMDERGGEWRGCAYFSHGMMLTRSKTVPVPSVLRAQTG